LWILLKHRGKRRTKNESSKWHIFWKALMMMVNLVDERDVYCDLNIKFDPTPQFVDDSIIIDDSKIYEFQQYGEKLQRRDMILDEFQSSVSKHFWLPLFVSALTDNVSDDFCRDISNFAYSFEDDDSEVENTAAHFIVDNIDEKSATTDPLKLFGMIYHQSPWVMYLMDDQGRYLLHAVAGNSLINAETLNFVLKANPRTASHLCHKGLSPMHSLLSNYEDTRDREKFEILFPHTKSALGHPNVRDYTPLMTLCFSAGPTCKDLIQRILEVAPISGADGPSTLPSVLTLVGYWWDRACNRNRSRDKVGEAEVYLLLMNADRGAVMRRDKDGLYPIHTVAAHGTLELLKAVYEAYPAALKVNVFNRGTPLHYAATSGDVEKVKYLYSLYPEAIKLPVLGSGELPLHYAVRGSLSCLRKIYEHYPQAIRRQSESDRKLPLHYLVGNLIALPKPADFLDMLRFLLKHYPRAVAVKDSWGDAPVVYLRRYQCITSHRLLLRAAPEVLSPKNLKALRLLNYEERRGALYLLFVAEFHHVYPFFLRLKKPALPY
jgi:hypothetical protein